MHNDPIGGASIVIMVHLLSSSLMFTTSNVVRDNLFIEKCCRLDLNLTEEVCYNMTHSGGIVSVEDKELVQVG